MAAFLEVLATIVAVVVIASMIITAVEAVGHWLQHAWPWLAASAGLLAAALAVFAAWAWYRYTWQPARRHNAARIRAAGHAAANTAPRRETRPVERPQHPEAYGLDPDEEEIADAR